MIFASTCCQFSCQVLVSHVTNPAHFLKIDFLARFLHINFRANLDLGIFHSDPNENHSHAHFAISGKNPIRVGLFPFIFDYFYSQ